MKKETSGHAPTARVVGILNILAEAPEGLSLTEISSITGYFKGTIHPVLQELISSKYVHFDLETKRYTLGIGSCVLASRFMESDSVFKLILDEMKIVVEVCSEICQLAVLDGPDVLYLAKIEAPQAIRLSSHVGKRLPANCTALGKALLSQHSFDELRELYKNGLERLTEHSIKTVEELYAELETVRKNSFAFDNREAIVNVKCCAVPICHKNKSVVAGLSVSVPDYRLEDGSWETIQGALIRAKHQIEHIVSTIPNIFSFANAR